MEIPKPRMGQKIKKLRELKNLTPSQMADELGVSLGTYAQIEAGETDVSYSKLNRIADLFGVGIDEITTFNEQLVFNIMHNQTANGYVVYKGFPESEKQYYEDKIRSLQEEISSLKNLMEKLIQSQK